MEAVTHNGTPYYPWYSLGTYLYGTVGERDPRRWGAWADRVGGGHLGIGWSPSDTGGQRRFTTADGAGIPVTEWIQRGGNGRGEHRRT